MNRKVVGSLLLISVIAASCAQNAYCPSYSSGTYNKHYKSTLPHYGKTVSK